MNCSFFISIIQYFQDIFSKSTPAPAGLYSYFVLFLNVHYSIQLMTINHSMAIICDAERGKENENKGGLVQREFNTAIAEKSKLTYILHVASSIIK